MDNKEDREVKGVEDNKEDKENKEEEKVKRNSSLGVKNLTPKKINLNRVMSLGHLRMMKCILQKK